MTEDWPILRSKVVAEGRRSASAFSSLQIAGAASDNQRFGWRKIDIVLSNLGADNGICALRQSFSQTFDRSEICDVWNAWSESLNTGPRRLIIRAALSEGTLV